MNEKPKKFIDDNGLRLDGRKTDEIRDIEIQVGVLGRADGSCYLKMGNNKVIAAVYGPREVHPRHQQNSTRAIVRYKYNMASFSVEDRKRPGPDRRSIEVSKVSREAIEEMVFTEYFPKSAIDIFVEVLQADAGTRTAALNAASVALADAGIPMRGLISSCAVGKVDDTLVLDLNKEEDNYGQADMPIAITPDGKITLLQMDGHLTQEEFTKALEMAQEGCRQVYEIQRKALLDYYTQKAGEEIIESQPPEEPPLEEEAPMVEVESEEPEVIEEEAVESIEISDETDKEQVIEETEEKEMKEPGYGDISSVEESKDSEEVDLADEEEDSTDEVSNEKEEGSN